MPVVPETLAKGCVVQIDPEYHKMFGGCLMVVTEVKSWGAMGYVMVPQGTATARAYLRVPMDKMVYIGKAAWFPFDEINDGDTTFGHA